MSEKQKEQIAAAFAMAKDNLVAFRKLFLPTQDDVDSPWFHYKWSDILLHGQQHYAIEGFRSSGKTSVVLRAFPLSCLVFPEKGKEFVIFVAANQDNASSRLKDITDEYLTNPLMKMNLVKVVQNSQKVFEAIVKGTDGEEHTVRIMAFGKGAAIRGLNVHDKRPDVILIDDPEDVEDAESDTIQERDYNWFLSDVYFLGKSSRIFMIGNNLGEKCLLERVMANKKMLNFETDVIPILNEDEQSNWPSMFPTEEILRERDDWTRLEKLDVWQREKLCMAVSPEYQMFRPDMYRYYDQSQFNREGKNFFTCVDLAISEKETADYTAVTTVAVDAGGNWFIQDIDYGRYNPTKTIEAIFEAVRKYHPIFVGIEKVGYQAALQHFLDIEMAKRNQFFTIKQLMAKDKKEVRIRGALQPLFQTGKLWFPVGGHFLPELKTELEMFPKGLHDDLADSLAYIDQVQFPPVDSWGEGGDYDMPLAGGL